MKLFTSIKWRLQLWYGLVLVVVLVGFGTTAYQLERGRQFRRLDEDLHRRLGFLLNAVRRGPPRGPGWEGPALERRLPPQGEGEADWPGPPGQKEDATLRPGEFHLPSAVATWFNASDPNGFYFVIIRAGQELARSTNAPPDVADENWSQMMQWRRTPGPARGDSGSNSPAEEPPEMAGQPGVLPEGQPGRLHRRSHYMELIAPADLKAGRTGEVILVGRNISRELAELHVTGWTLTGVGAVILVLGLSVGGWLVGRALQPVADIGATAVKISAGDLSQRINIAETDSELGRLAGVLNATFTRLERAFTQQKQFAADAAHELRTPVTVLLTQTQAALSRERDAASYKQTVEACQRAAQRMRRLIESLLELARFDAGQEVLRHEPVDFAGLVADGVDLVQPLAAAQPVTLTVESVPVTVAGDGERLAQVVANLLTNAIQYNRPDGKVRVQLARQNELAVLTVADTGRGIAADDLPRVFERFYRADQARTGGSNAGLGLAICQAIVSAHGGTIEVASEAGAGTTFTVRLPLAGETGLA